MAVNRESTIQILYGGSTVGAPADLSDGELAYAHGSKNLFVGAGGNNTAVKIGAEVLDEDDFNSNSATSLASQQSIKTYVDNSIGASAGVTSIEALTGSVNVAAGSGIGVSTSGSGSGTLTISGTLASTSALGIASFDSDDFNVSNGDVSLSNSSISFITDDANTKIASLGANLNIAGADGVATTSSGNTLSFGLSNSGIANSKLANSTITVQGATGIDVSGGSSVGPSGFVSSSSIASLGQTLTLGVTSANTSGRAGIASFSSTYFTTAGTGTPVVSIKSNSISNTQLANSSVTLGNVTVALGGNVASPAFDLSSATGLDPVSGISGGTLTLTTSTDSGSFDVNLGDTIDFLGTTNQVRVTNSGNKVQVGLPDDVTITGSLTVNGTVTTVNSTTVKVDDPLIRLADGNSANSLAIGFIGDYNDGSAKVTGIARDHRDDKFYVFDDVASTNFNTSQNTIPDFGTNSSNIATLVCKVNAGTYS